MRCGFCGSPMAYVHGHAACVDGRCPFHGRNQAECCDGETAENCPVPTAALAGPGTAPLEPPRTASSGAPLVRRK